MTQRDVRIVPKVFGMGFKLQWRSNYMSFWRTYRVYPNLWEASKARANLLVANGVEP